MEIKNKENDEKNKYYTGWFTLLWSDLMLAKKTNS